MLFAQLCFVQPFVWTQSYSKTYIFSNGVVINGTDISLLFIIWSALVTTAQIWCTLLPYLMYDYYDTVLECLWNAVRWCWFKWDILIIFHTSSLCMNMYDCNNFHYSCFQWTLQSSRLHAVLAEMFILKWPNAVSNIHASWTLVFTNKGYFCGSHLFLLNESNINK